jgi:hypothetical protein
MRVIKLGGSPDDWTSLEAVTGGAEVIKAVGYLSTWSRDGYGFVDIYPNARQLEMTAVYRKEDSGDVGYVIGAVWHEGHFGFHS